MPHCQEPAASVQIAVPLADPRHFLRSPTANMSTDKQFRHYGRHTIYRNNNAFIMVLSENKTIFWKRHLALCSTVSLLGSPVCNNAAYNIVTALAINWCSEYVTASGSLSSQHYDNETVILIYSHWYLYKSLVAWGRTSGQNCSNVKQSKYTWTRGVRLAKKRLRFGFAKKLLVFGSVFWGSVLFMPSFISMTSVLNCSN